MSKHLLAAALLAGCFALGAPNAAHAQTGDAVTTTARGNLEGMARLSERHTTLLKALQASGLADKARGAEKYTVFAPTNAAFGQLPAGQLAELMRPAGKDRLAQLLAHHVVPGSYLAANLQDGMQLTTVLGETLTVRRSADTITITDATGHSATMLNDDIVATNGIVHTLDAVLMPDNPLPAGKTTRK
ncbi:fasciclin domain-containing protein [Hymenobacter oligotrophus]|uniref:Fasciclin domain-containing protein n=1 Tax=Hymenobacter oligotrophus TaxID=2319843 RepID=A0A3B7QVI6_9BACT|nr:fasciclin domain-containing protein [Hymenobacter oligotrophus]AYA37108.1 fasciclin domain-containing protein [Hymenobacter oligotrophus]